MNREPTAQSARTAAGIPRLRVVEDVKGSSYEAAAAVVGIVAERPSGPGLQGVVTADVVLVRAYGPGATGRRRRAGVLGLAVPKGQRLRRVVFYSVSGHQVAAESGAYNRP